MSVETVIKGVTDRFGRGLENSLANWSTGTDFWHRVDGADDVDFENTVKGLYLSEMDTALSTAKLNIGEITSVLQLLNNYFNILGLTTSPLFDAYLDTKKWRVPERFADLFYSCMGNRFDPEYVFPKGVTPADNATPVGSGMHEIGNLTTTTWAEVDGGIDTTEIVGAIICAVNMTTGTAGATFTVTCADDTTRAIVYSGAGASQFKQTDLGETTFTSGGTVGSTAIVVGSNANMCVDGYALIVEDAVEEIVKLSAVNVNGTGLTLSSGLINVFTAAAKVYPLFTDCVYTSGGSGTVKVYARPDRIIAL